MFSASITKMSLIELRFSIHELKAMDQAIKYNVYIVYHLKSDTAACYDY